MSRVSHSLSDLSIIGHAKKKSARGLLTNSWTYLHAIQPPYRNFNLSYSYFILLLIPPQSSMTRFLPSHDLPIDLFQSRGRFTHIPIKEHKLFYM